MIIISPHARKAMKKHLISEDEVKIGVIEGRREFEIVVEGEKRYGNVLIEKPRKLVIIWSYDKKGNKRVITCYPLKRKV